MTPAAAATLPPAIRVAPKARRWRYSYGQIRRRMPVRGGDAHHHGGHCQAGSDDRADRGPGARATFVDEILHGHAGLLGGEQERGMGWRIGGVMDVGADLHDWAAA